MGELLFVILFYIVALYIIYWVIKGAIDNSKLAKDIKEIRKLLSMQYSKTPTESQDTYEEEIVLPEDLTEECPACHEKISPTYKKCPSCGLTLIIDE
ncbi:hypothetical protein [Brassicibacter mesophilus]|uniref:hypothetical protein n=1 Tax=Brassicibacter mesophilus TaxID=745119 RepID=UPI003D1DF464